jgi:hypothetical protein
MRSLFKVNFIGLASTIRKRQWLNFSILLLFANWLSKPVKSFPSPFYLDPIMSELCAAVYIAPPIPFASPSGKGAGGVWSPISSTLIYSANEAVLVDTPITIKQTEELIAWIKKIAPG